MKTYTKMLPHIEGSEYETHFWNAIRGKQGHKEHLMKGIDTATGAFTLTPKGQEKYMTAIKQESLFRSLATDIQIYDHAYNIKTVEGDDVAVWVPEGGTIPITDGMADFSDIALASHKLAVFLKLEDALIRDPYFKVEDYLVKRLAKNFGRAVLRNYAYTGNLILQQTYRENHLTKRTLQNNGELPQYHITDSHEPIIPLRQFIAVQEEIKRRADKHTHPGVKQKTYPFTGMIVCGGCGKHYRRKVTKTGPVWICSTFNTMGKAYCPSKQIPERTLISITEEVLGSTDALYDKITAIRAEKDNTLVFCFKDGSETVKRWTDRSRAESWTEEMKEAARQKALERSKSNG